MQLVIDTNVLVSGLLNASGAPGQLLDKILHGHVIPVYNAEILAEYAAVLARRKFSFDPNCIAALMELITTEGWPMYRIEHLDIHLPDPDDRPFYECAAAAKCPLVTGNLKDFPQNGPVEVLSPA